MAAIGFRRLCTVVAALLLQTAVLKAALPGADGTPGPASLTGELLVAAPELNGSDFERAVILVVKHGPEGALGVVINKPLGERPMTSVFKGLVPEVTAVNVPFYSGGPVQPGIGLVVHSAEYRQPETVALTDQLSLTTTVGILQDIANAKGPSKFLIALGYAGWGPGQLENEIHEHAWTIAQADPSLVFDLDRTQVWDEARKKAVDHF